MHLKSSILSLSKRVVNKLERHLEPPQELDPVEALTHIPRYTPGEFLLNDQTIYFPDSASFYFIYKELFRTEIYKFKSEHNQPLIIDCGANIGLSVIYFKQLYPNARIIAFEPDAEIYAYLEKNVRYLNEKGNVRLYKKALWDSNDTLEFKNEGADGGRVSLKNDSTTFNKFIQVEAVRLSEFINEPVSFLKIDIEGAETKVIKEIEDKLYLVDNIFIEYHSFESLPQELDEILAILSRNNFRYYLDTPGKIRSTPFTDKTTYSSFDFLINIYAIRG
jgi:FkbM family methyltransferase